MIEVWEDTSMPFAPTVTIRKSGTFAISQGAQNKFRFGTEIQHVSLAYDSEKRIVLFVPVTNSHKSAVPLVRVGKPLVVYAKKFFHKFDIDFSRTMRFNLEKTESYPGLKSSTPVYTIDLSSPLGRPSDDSSDEDDADESELQQAGAGSSGEK